ncbi:MAG: alkaline phosphatase family protein [Desulfobacteraceae bacterium]|nr:alkaline phosphatase family protein [Desulfobacteraceae bacterium]
MTRGSVLVLFAVLCLVISGQLWGLSPILTPKDTPVLGEFDPYLLETLYKAKNNDTGLVSIVKEDRFKELIEKHKLTLFGGPMLGCITDTSARFWVRTPGSVKVLAIISKDGKSSKLRKTNTVQTRRDSDYVALLDIKNLAPNCFYQYDILVDGKSVYKGNPPSFRTYPAKGQKVKFDVGFGGGARYRPEKEFMWDVIASHSPIAFLFLGDNVYIDQPNSRTKQRVHYYRRQLRPEYRRLTASTAIYAIYDDHDFGKNDCAGGLDPFKPRWKLPVWRVFKQNWNNPYYGGGEKQPGCWFDFSIGDVDFFMVDNRYYRSFKDGTMLGPVQKKWLLSGLKASKATFKVIASGTLWTEHADKGGRDSWWGVREEREEIFSLIDNERIGGVILLSADRHRTDVYRIERPNGYDLYEFETSKLTNKHTHWTKEEALFSYNKGNFFGLLSFDLTKSDPEVTFQCITMDKKSVYKLTLKRSQLQTK